MTRKITLLLVGMLVSLFATQAQVNETQRLISNDIAEEDYFGNGVAVSGDYAIIGACYDDENGTNSGSAYIFYNNAGTWEQYQKLTASDGQTNEFFAITVAIYGNYAFATSLGANSYAGKVYVFHNDGGTWTETAILTASDTEESDLFGLSMSIAGDYAIIGAYGNEDNGSQSGSAYIFQNNAGIWTETAKLLASDGNENDFFGISVDIEGDYAIVGANGSANNSGANSGTAYVFHNNSGNWAQTQKIESADAVVGDHFGTSVSISGDYIAVGADYKSESETWEGAAYIFKNNSGIWEQQQKLNDSNPGSQKHYGSSIYISGDTLIIGAEGNISFSPYHEGSAYVFLNNADTWEEQAIIQASDIGLKDQFAYVVDFSNNFAFVGSPRSDTDYEDGGAVYVFEVVFTNIITQPVSQEDITLGEDIVFSVEAEGLNLTYQWRRNEVNLTDGGNINGSTTNELTITSVTNDDEGIYDCIVSGDYGVVISEDAILSILGPPVIITDPEDATICDGENTSFTITADDADSYQWQVNTGSYYNDISEGGVYSNVTTATLNITTATSDMDGYLFRCVATNASGSTNSGSASLTVLNATEITTQPVSQLDIIVGTDIFLLVEAEGANLNYQWRKDEEILTDGGNISGSTTNELSISSITYDDAGTYDCNVTGSCGEVISDNAILSILTGTNEVSEQDIFIYPNPTTGKINFKNTNNSIQKLSVYDIRGKTIIENSEIQQNVIIDLSNFESGIYIISIQTEKEILKAKIIKR